MKDEMIIPGCLRTAQVTILHKNNEEWISTIGGAYLCAVFWEIF